MHTALTKDCPVYDSDSTAAPSRCTISMLGVDPYWERVHLAYHYEVEKRTKAHRTANASFEPGEIAFVNDDGTLGGAFYDFLEWQGMSLSPEEKINQRNAKRNRHGRYCLVLDRLDNDAYIVCYLTSFHQAQHGTNIQTTLARLFAIAIDETPEFPLGTPSIKVVPKWAGYGFLYAMPVCRWDLAQSRAINTRFILRLGELERVKKLILERVKFFKANHQQIRIEELRSRKKKYARESEDADVDDDEIPNISAGEPTTLAASADDFETISDTTSITSSSVLSSERAFSTSQPTFRPQSWSMYPHKLPRIHYLETNEHWINLRWLLQTMRLDIIHSSYYLNDINMGRRVYKGAASILKRLPIR